MDREQCREANIRSLLQCNMKLEQFSFSNSRSIWKNLKDMRDYKKHASAPLQIMILTSRIIELTHCHPVEGAVSIALHHALRHLESPNTCARIMFIDFRMFRRDSINLLKLFTILLDILNLFMLTRLQSEPRRSSLPSHVLLIASSCSFHWGGATGHCPLGHGASHTAFLTVP